MCLMPEMSSNRWRHASHLNNKLSGSSCSSFGLDWFSFRVCVFFKLMFIWTLFRISSLDTNIELEYAYYFRTLCIGRFLIFILLIK